MNEDERNIKRVGHYLIDQADISDCVKCKNAKQGTVLIDGLCIDCHDDEVKAQLSSIQYQIINQISIACNKAGMGTEVLVLLGSWGDTQEENDILEMFEQYNECGTYKDRVLFQIGDTKESIDKRNMPN